VVCLQQRLDRGALIKERGDSSFFYNDKVTHIIIHCSRGGVFNNRVELEWKMILSRSIIVCDSLYLYLMKWYKMTMLWGGNHFGCGLCERSGESEEKPTMTVSSGQGESMEVLQDRSNYYRNSR